MSEHTKLPHAEGKRGPLPSPALLLQRKCACGNQATDGGECAECKKENDGVQRKAAGKGTFRIPAATHDVLASAGHPLDSGTRDHMERHFNHDFSRVRVHNDAKAAASAQAVRASAYTVGSHVVFGAGRYAPATSSGQELLAHELAHTIQQQIGRNGDYRTAEREADRAAESIHAGARIDISSPGAREPMQRQDADEDKDRATIVGVTKRTGNLKGRAWELVWRMLSRYFPEYVDKISGVAYDEKELSVRVDVKPIEVQGKKTQTATVTVGKQFVESSSDEKLRTRINELELALSNSGLKAEGDGAPAGALWKIIHDKFPQKGRRLGGTSYDAKLPGLRTEFEAGQVTVGKVTKSWSGAIMYFGKAFLALLPADQEKKVGEELAKVDQWCVENGRLEKADLADRDIADRIRGLSAAKMIELRDKVADPDVKKYVESLTSMSTPLEFGLTRQAGGDASAQIGNVRVVVRPDVSGGRGAPAVGGRTDYTLPGRPSPRGLAHFANGRLQTFDGFPPITITIATTYARSADLDAPSAYGRGTTRRDTAVGATTLRFHEGSHGLDYLQFIHDNPYPTFAWQQGMTTRQFNAAIAEYDRARRAYDTNLQHFSEARTHCDPTGITIDELNQQRHIRARRQCR